MWTFLLEVDLDCLWTLKVLGKDILDWKAVQPGTWQRQKMCLRNILVRLNMRFVFSKCDFIIPTEGEERPLVETGDCLMQSQAGEQNLNENKTWVAQESSSTDLPWAHQHSPTCLRSCSILRSLLQSSDLYAESWRSLFLRLVESYACQKNLAGYYINGELWAKPYRVSELI